MEFNSRSVAPLDLVGKEVTDGITITPAIAGKWSWDSDNRLLFIPDTDWPANQRYDIAFNKTFFAAGTHMSSWKTSFTTLPFDVTITEFKFYQDPVHSSLRQAVATLQFTFPVDEASLKKNITLQWQSFGREQVPYTLTYDENKRIAYLHSETLSLPKSEQYLELTLAKGIKSQTGSDKLSKKVSATLLIPNAESFFKVSETGTSIIRNQQDRPEQILTIETTLGVTEAELAKSVHAYLLPKDYPATAAETVKTDYQWQNPAEVTETILALAKPINLQAIPLIVISQPCIVTNTMRLHLLIFI